ncbi:MAG: hypothetical protein IKC87_03605 [Clostridia bacterium]|nr:hypothetical protein [Clostridia bacterium]
MKHRSFRHGVEALSLYYQVFKAFIVKSFRKRGRRYYSKNNSYYRQCRLQRTIRLNL